MKVYSNFKLNFPHEILTFQQLVNCELNNCIVLLDEAHIFGFDSRESMSKGNRELVKNFIVQVRKQNVQLFTTSQRPRQLDIRLKSNSDFALYCTKFVYDEKNRVLKECTQSSHFSEKIKILINVDVVKGDNGKEGTFVFCGNPYYKYYDTREVIKLSSNQKDKALEVKMKDENPEQIKGEKNKKTSVKKNKTKTSKKKK